MEVAIVMNQRKPKLTLEDYYAAYTMTQFIPNHQSLLSGKRKQHDKVSNIHSTKRSKLVDSYEEAMLLLVVDWYLTKLDPRRIFGNAFVAEIFSEPIKKQLTGSDVDPNQLRLMLGKSQVKELMLPLLKQSETPKGSDGLDVLVYGPDPTKGAHKMQFKLWNDDTTPVLTSGWKGFVEKHGLEKHYNFLTVWMFRHRVTQKICFAIDIAEFPIYTLLPSNFFKSLD